VGKETVRKCKQLLQLRIWNSQSEIDEGVVIPVIIEVIIVVAVVTTF
jgi:hypothetical protein